jgi:hypothetical protein
MVARENVTGLTLRNEQRGHLIGLHSSSDDEERGTHSTTGTTGTTDTADTAEGSGEKTSSVYTMGVVGVVATRGHQHSHPPAQGTSQVIIFNYFLILYHIRHSSNIPFRDFCF